MPEHLTRSVQPWWRHVMRLIVRDNKGAEKQLRWVLEQKPTEAYARVAGNDAFGSCAYAADKQHDAAIALLVK
jgi:hypothetical protein